jgi:deoxyribodipyrimidine photolyase-like uncharacterized protein
MTQNNLLLILGNQLFPINEISKIECKTVFMKEDLGLATDYFHHKLKIHMFFVAMRPLKQQTFHSAQLNPILEKFQFLMKDWIS